MNKGMPTSKRQTNTCLVVVCQLFYPEMISTGQTLTELMEELSARGLAITVIAAQPTVLPGVSKVPARIEHAGMTILRMWSTRFRKTSFVGKLLNQTTFSLTAAWEVLWRHHDAQLLLLTNPPYLPLLGWLCHLTRRQRFGVVLFDIMPQQAELLEFIKPGGLIAGLWRRLNHVWYRAADYTIVLSRDMLKGALENARLAGTPEEAVARAKTHVIHVWSDDRLINPAPKCSSQEAVRLGVTSRFVVQYSGNHGRFHDIETLVGIARTFAEDPGLAFQFIGEGQKKTLVEQWLKVGRPTSVYSSSYVSKHLLADSLAMCDLGVVAQMPGQEKVCYPSKLLGIMAAGRAVLAICPPDCEMARMIREHDIGWVVPNGDIAEGRRVLLEAQSNPVAMREKGHRAVQLLRERFTLQQAADQYCRLIAGGGDSVAPTASGQSARETSVDR